MSLFTPSVAACALALAAIWVLWQLLREYVTKSPLDNIPGPKPESVLTGNLVPFFDRVEAWDYHRRLQSEFGTVVRIQGVLGARILYVHDPQGLQEMMRQHKTYPSPDWILSVNNMIFGPGLISLEGEHHSVQRKIVTPVFSGEQLRGITPLLYQVIHKLCDSITSQVQKSGREVDMLGWMTRVALEAIAQGGFGHSLDKLDVEDTTRHPIRDAIQDLIPAVQCIVVWRAIAAYVEKMGSPQFRRRIAERLPHKGFQWIKQVADCLWDTSSKIMQERTATLQKVDEDWVDGSGKSKDILTALMKLNKKASESERLPDEEVLAQMGTLLFAGTDTTSNALARTLQLLATHPEVQDKLRREILEVRGTDGGELEFETLESLPYLDAVCRETLRIYPSINLQPRRASQDTVMHLSHPLRGVDGKTISEIFIPKGTDLLISFGQSNTKEELWGPDAMEWKPERWLSPLPRAVTAARVPGVYSNLMTFGGGKHGCIGFRFAQLEMKVVISELIANFRFSLSNKEIIWNYGGINYPSIDKEGTKHGLILNVEPIASL